MRRRIPLFLFPVALVASSFLLFGLLLYRLFSSESSVWTPFCGNEDIEGGGNTMPNQLTSGRRTYKRSVVEVAYTSFYSIMLYFIVFNSIMAYSTVFYLTVLKTV